MIAYGLSSALRRAYLAHKQSHWWWQGTAQTRFTTTKAHPVRRWTSEESKILLECKRRGQSLEEIGVVLKRTTKSVERYYYRRLFHGKVWEELRKLGPVSPGQDSEIRKLKEEGMSWRRIGQTMGLSTQSCMDWWKRAQSPTKSAGRGYTRTVRLKRWSEEEEGRLIDLVRTKGMSHSAASAAMGRSIASISRRLQILTRKGHPPSADKPYSAEEDNIIRKLKEEQGKSFRAIAAEMPGRSTGGLRSRYYKSIATDPAVRTVNRFTPAEDAVILRMGKKDGLKIKEIATRLVGRKSKGVRQRYHLLMRAEGTPSPAAEVTKPHI